jgi:hypothetical protein
MAFKLYGTLVPNEGRQLIGGDAVPQMTIGANNTVLQIGDKVEWNSSGFIVGGASSTAATDPVGIVVAVGQNGAAIDPDSGTTDTYTMASDNQTVAKKYAIIDISNNTLYTVPLDATPGTTTGSNLPGYEFNALASDGSKLDEDTVVTNVTGSTSFNSWGVDPDASGSVIVNMKQGAHHKLIA